MSKSRNTSALSDQSIRVCILWHQHQPYYRIGDRFVMPWVWLHATKDYLEMAQHLERHPGVKATINLVPSLLKQIEEYLSGDVNDPVVDLMSKASSELSANEKEFMLDNFFLANPDTVIKRSPRYYELFERWQGGDRDFSEQDYRDLSIHYSLAWTGEINRRSEPWKHLVAKDRGYTEEDRRELVAAQRIAVEQIFSLHRSLAASGQVELSTSPFYHPILPLVADTNVARESIRDISLPLHRFARTDDAELQLSRAIEHFQEVFGVTPKGLWPGEGSVSNAALRLIRKSGIEWTATDEGVLERSLGHHAAIQHPFVQNGLAKFTPWKYDTGEDSITIFFRDHRISDNIGFTYQSWDARDAVADVLGHIKDIRTKIMEVAPDSLGSACVSIILDGENCWEYYPNNGFEFLDALYSALESSSTIRTCTYSEATQSDEPYPSIQNVVAGSWINSNFRIWIGHPEDNAAWDALYAVREAFTIAEQRASQLPEVERAHAQPRLQSALEHILVAEGSDWCWWYGDDHHSSQRDLFDALFRQHLRAVYVLLGRPVPEDLLLPIIDRPDLAARYRRPSQEESRPGQVPHIAGKLLNDSWIGIPNCAPPKVFGAMHRSFDREIEDLRVARVGSEVLVRLILSPAVRERTKVFFKFESPASISICFSNEQTKLTAGKATYELRGYFDETLECAIPAELIGGTNEVRFKLEVLEPDGRRTAIPETGTIECSINQVEIISSEGSAR
jgi:alpha-amylase/alpha-mannosidase (GH57 family)